MVNRLVYCAQHQNHFQKAYELQITLHAEWIIMCTIHGFKKNLIIIILCAGQKIIKQLFHQTVRAKEAL
ncbi:MAG: hypothetical protein H0T84_04335 [Tatlockia sp.]|nr:hypothetical protein [Tatlockia sp.]